MVNLKSPGGVFGLREVHGLFMVAPCSLTDCVREERAWLASASQLYVLLAQLYVTLVIMKIWLPRKGVSSTRRVSPFYLI